MITRVATVDDAEAISRVHVASWQAAYRGMLPDSYLDSLAVTPRWIENWRSVLDGADGSTALTLVATDDGVIGFAHVGPSRDDDSDARTVGELWSIYARPERYGTGVGRALMLGALVALRANYVVGTLWVLADNARARRFYEAGGWTADGTSKPVEIGGTSLAEVRYRLPLATACRSGSAPSGGIR